MEEYELTKRFKITRPIVFLCGPSYDKNNSSDRRNILRNTISRVYRGQKQDVLPLIVDSFLTSKNFDFKEYSIQLIEEICAAVSFQTYILLDTMSSATELGMFANSVYDNEICVYIPKTSDVYNQGNVGYFVREAVLKRPTSKIEVIEYRPQIIKRAYSSVFTAEHYGFNDDKIPKNILQSLTETAKRNPLSCDMQIEYDNSTKFPTEVNHISYSIESDILTISVPVKLLFYVTASILHNEKIEITKQKEGNLSNSEINEIVEMTKCAIVNSVCFDAALDKRLVNKTVFYTKLNAEIDSVIKHIVKFIIIYYTKSQFQSMNLIESSSAIVKKREIGFHPNVLFPLSEEQKEVIKQLNSNSSQCYERRTITSGRKQREIITYADNEMGYKFRELHCAMDEMFRQRYKHSEYSYAYHKGSNIKKCVSCHVDSTYFIKLDIKNFFGSISQEIIVKKLISHFQIDKNYIGVLRSIISGCFVDEKLPIGLVSSPIFSDFYLNDFDYKIGEICKRNDLIYTRYADDIMISSKSSIEGGLYEAIIREIKNDLSLLQLTLNDDKMLHVNFAEEETYIRYIGINIVKGKGNNPNYLSVGKKYIYLLAKDYLEYQNIVNNNKALLEDAEQQTRLFYKRAEIIGKIDFIRQIEGERGVERLKIRLKKYYPEVDLFAV